MKKILCLALLLIASAFMLAGCGGNNNDDPTPDTGNGTTATPTPGTGTGGGTGDTSGTPATQLRTEINLLTGDHGNFDPHFPAPGANNIVMQQIFDRLNVVHADGYVEWHLAVDYSVSDDGLLWNYYLRQGVVFSNGQPFSAHDVVFSINLARTSPALAPFVGEIADVIALDDYTVQFVLHHEHAPFFFLMSLIFIANEYTVTSMGDESSMYPVGTGPYMIDWSSPVNISQGYSLIRNPLYWGEAPQIERINYSIVVDALTGLLAFEAGQIDRISLPLANVASILAQDQWAVDILPTTGFTFATMNSNIAPFDDVRVRRAMNHAINREELILLAFDGFGDPATIMANPAMVFGAIVPDDVLDYNPELARQLFAEAGVTDLGTLYMTAGARIPEVMQAQLRRVGVNIELGMTDMAFIHEGRANGTIALSLEAHGLPGDFFIWQFFLHSVFSGSMNMAFYENPEVDALFALALTQTNPADREATYAQLLRIVNQDAPYVPLLFPNVAYARDRALDTGRFADDGRVANWQWR